MSHQTENVESSDPFIPTGHRSGAVNAQDFAAFGTDAAYRNAAQNQPPALEVSGISKTFGRGRRETRVLNNVSLTVRPQEFVSILGPSGCGKSTLFHIIGGLEAPDTGTVSMNGRTVTGKRGEISYMPQQPALFPWRSTLDNVLLAGELKGEPLAAARENARRWLGRVGLGGFEQAYPHMLSGGMQQRAAFLRALLAPQELMLLDEPFSALDALTRSDMQRWLLELWEENRRSVLFITHNIEEALLLSSRIYVFSGRPGSILHTVDVPFPRPRREEITDTPEFLQLKRQLSQWMREEQAKDRK
ncbi:MULTISPECIES: ABC transporter ATP-binding protein [unclassified Paenibacillus]|uniref:ABC transporter ATP-binding protein n=1 Tax=unclassified Paenibacillus TaxID=185978 RepID=UPI0024052D33|nr:MULTISPECIES: ABC transporter ATP-binding protein [unclassified Paenibacillus]MDF9840940.1 ABC-type nitrate/sulfonate/bicarbonate transport system ATPase subunit [Paenibacillus sp. PastF-2]MDF9847524.1 ABC-type nitrate/sulfonate/bicarbonate transport system ATPase subunit [Paenibacillus sp. PastM-2]MDF9853900.1 ABC-type nitrate/sulfonate/bicarbonate transport system ATPase subunit [Paenibacillus sp. PastF-1]MDH6479171.1 ABC-type nitrate/sulfonate/bicarbonate transport system ATPase subunit [